MKRLLLYIVLISGTQLCAADTSETALTFKAEKKRIKEYLYEGRRYEVGQACKSTRRYTKPSRPFILQHMIDDSFRKLSPKFREAKTVDELLLIEKQAQALNKLLMQLILIVDNGCLLHDTILAASQDELECLAIPTEADFKNLIQPHKILDKKTESKP